MKTICLDFDGVLAHYTEWNGKIGNPNLEGIKLARMLKTAGFKIVIQTCRWHTSWNDPGHAVQEVQNWLKKHNVPYDNLELGSKAFAAVYVDDRAVHFPLNQGPADEVYEEIISRLSQSSEGSAK